MNRLVLRDDQLAVCRQHGVQPHPPETTQNCGWSPTAAPGALPLNGLRHPPTDTTSGWYFWGGDRWSDAVDFFQPLCVAHLLERCPDVVPYLALPPGWRFLLAPGYVDVWYDPSLLDV